jgi:uncharacterized protein YdaU (DUF1376 family)
VNYYEHHLGDWAAATGHLTWDEDMAYTRLLRAYYHAEKAIPQGQQYRLAKATTPAQRRAVDAVIAEFFALVDGAFHQKRAEAEISRFQDKQRKAKQSANARWAHTERNANASPEEDADGMRTHSEGNAPRARPQTPDTRHHIEEANASSLLAVRQKTPKAAKRCPDDFAPDPDAIAWAAEIAPGVDISAETAKLRDHTFSTARSDWPATWRNWIRKAAEAPRRTPANGSMPEPEWRREQRERNEAFLGPAAKRRNTQTTIDMEAPDVTPRLVG